MTRQRYLGWPGKPSMDPFATTLSSSCFITNL
jgi:hypothetical protein